MFFKVQDNKRQEKKNFIKMIQNFDTQTQANDQIVRINLENQLKTMKTKLEQKSENIFFHNVLKKSK